MYKKVSVSKNVNLSQQAYESIKYMIKYGELKQGDIVSISGMAEALNISRTPVTLACQRLEQERLLTIKPKQGVIITTITIDDAREIYELRAAIESYSAKLAFSRIGPNDISFLQDCLERQRTAMEVGDIYAFMEEDTEFHKYLLSCYENAHFSDLIEPLIDRAFMIGVKNSSYPVRLRGSIQEHESIIDALIRGDRDALTTCVERNLINGYITLTGHYGQ